MKKVQLTNSQVNAIISKYQTSKDSRVLAPLMQHLQPYLLSHAHRYGAPGFSWEQDLAQECTFVIMKLALTYVPSADKTFEDHIGSEVQHCMAAFIREHGCTVSRPPRTRIVMFMDSIDDYLDNDDDDCENNHPTINVAQLEALMCYQPSLDEDNRLVCLNKALDTLRPLERLVIDKSFCFQPDDDAIIANELNISVHRLRQLRNQTLRILRIRMDQLLPNQD